MSLSRRQVEALVLAVAIVTTGTGIHLLTTSRTVSTELTTNAPTLGTLGSGDERVPAPETVPESVRSLHDAGVTGAGVTVGVVDATGFDVDHPSLEPSVRATRAFGGDVENAGENAHGTAAALTVAAVAPDAELLLANADSPATAAKAVRWAHRRGADVLVVPVNELGAADTGSGTLANAVRDVSTRGTLVVVPTGNSAAGHWEGRLHPTQRNRQRFGSTTRLWLRPPAGSAREPGGAVRLWASWNGSAYPRDLSIDLYRVAPDGPQRVSTSNRVRSDGVYSERLAALVRPGDLFVAVRFENRTVRRFETIPVTLELTATNHRLEPSVARGSIAAPATAEAALAVGAVGDDGVAVARYSGRGPTADGRRGIDLVAPTRVWPGDAAGTSAAAAYTGGVAALVTAAAPDASVRTRRTALVRSAVDVGAAGADPQSGHGLLAPREAVACAGDGDVGTCRRDVTGDDAPTTDRRRANGDSPP